MYYYTVTSNQADTSVQHTICIVNDKV